MSRKIKLYERNITESSISTWTCKWDIVDFFNEILGGAHGDIHLHV